MKINETDKNGFLTRISKKIQFCISFFVILTVCYSALSSQELINKGSIILNEKGYPFIFELNPGESQTVTRTWKEKTITREIKLISVKLFREPNLWFDNSISTFNYYAADVLVEISGKPATIHHRPYQMPQTVDSIRIYIENIKDWDDHGKLGREGNLRKQVRFSVCSAHDSWGPESIIFPLNNFHWRSSVYNNTWSGLVPFNLLYYHRGEDFGAVPDKIEVVSPIKGRITRTPLPNGDGGSNTFCIRNEEGLEFSFSHMDIETIDKKLVGDESIESGEVIGKTGMTWNGRRSQYQDPHLHVELRHKGVALASFPYLMEAYMRKYPDEVFAVAGGYRFALPGDTVALDASRSFTRDSKPVKSCIWKLSDGRTINNMTASVIHNQPGIYSEELTVFAQDGNIDKDFLYLVVFDPKDPKNLQFGWAYYYPVRDLKPNDDILFLNRLKKTDSDVMINYGDTPEWSSIKEESRHAYGKPGLYVVTLKSGDNEKMPVTLKMEVRVD